MAVDGLCIDADAISHKRSSFAQIGYATFRQVRVVLGLYQKCCHQRLALCMRHQFQYSHGSLDVYPQKVSI